MTFLLESLNVENLILVEKAEIEFGKTLNILTGETGAGKSAILTAVRLLMGEKADPDLIRSGSNLSVIEAKVRFANPSSFCHEEGLDLPMQKSCLIRRELSRSGKSRAFFNDEQISLASLRKLMTQEIEFVDQNSARDLSSPQRHRELLDLWARAPSFTALYQEQLSMIKECQTLKERLSSAEIALARAKSDLAEIEQASWKGSEEELELDREHKQLTSSHSLVEQLSQIQQELASVSITPLLRRLANRCKLQDVADLFKSAGIELQEAERILEQSLSQHEVDPKRLIEIEERIGVLERLKRRFGNVSETQSHLKAQIKELENLGDTLEDLEKRVQTVSERNRLQAQELSKLRKQAALTLSEQLASEIQALNLANARFEVRLESKEMGPDGIDQVRFFFSANIGEPLRPLEECASGGEQSRLLFVFKSLFAQKEGRSCLIFDEIDSNIGGQTAAILGQKLARLADECQVVSITHFVQVAKQASHHFLVSKSSEEGKTKTCIQKLNKDERALEYARMVGKGLGTV